MHPLKPAPTDIPYYHATFRANATSILVEGLRVDVSRLWKCYASIVERYFDYIYLEDDPIDSVKWVISYLAAPTEDKKDSFGNTFRDFHNIEPDGITIFEIDATGIEIMSGMSDDFVARDNISPQKLKIYGVIDPFEVWELAELVNRMKGKIDLTQSEKKKKVTDAINRRIRRI